jgi:hypothetical protein
MQRRRQLTEDRNTEISGRDLRESGGGVARSYPRVTRSATTAVDG